MESTNIFSYATSELSQDAFICWLLSFALKENHGKDSALEACALGIIHQIPKLETAKEILKIETQVKIPGGRIDVLLTVEDYFVIIEDKTFTNARANQLSDYKQGIINRHNKTDADHVICVFYKIIEQARPEKVDFELTREKILPLLQPYKKKTNNDVFLYYVERLEYLDSVALRYKNQPIKEWEELTYRGFFKYLTQQAIISLESEYSGWDKVNNQNGGFMGLWWGFCNEIDPSGVCFDSVYLQIENNKITVKIYAEPLADYKADDLCKARQQIFDYFDSRLKDFVRNKRWAIAKTMTVGYIEYNESNYREKIGKMQQAFDDMRKNLRITI